MFHVSCCSNLFAREAADRPVEVNGDQVEFLHKENKILGTGNVSVDYGNVKLTSDKITVDTETKDAVAEGNVTIKSPTSEIRGEKLKYNFESKTGEILDIRLKSGEWYAGGKEAHLLPDKSVRITDGYLTSCDKIPPHYKISAGNINISPDNKLIARNVSFKAGKIPLMYFPVYEYSLDTDWPTFNILPGKKSKWGVFALMSYRHEFDEKNRLTLRLDEREKWGPAEGLDYKYEFDTIGTGIFKTYYSSQRNRDRNEIQKGEEDRFRVQLRHRWDPAENITGFLELHELSDDEMVKDYFYREEYDSDPSPESYAYLLNSESEYSLSFLAKKRMNRFFSVVEKLPEARFNLKDQRLFDSLPLYFKTDTTATHLNSKTANSGTDLDVTRFDTYNKLSGSFRVADFISLSPFAGIRETLYSKDINGDEDENRTAFYTGIDVSTKFFKTYGTTGNFLGVEINKLHHVVTPTLEYEYIHEPSTTPGNLQQFDDIDSIDRKSKFTLGLENKFQTKRLKDGEMSTVDLGYLLITGDYLSKPEEGSRFSNVKGDLEIMPLDWLRIESDTLYDPDTRDFQDWNVDVHIDKENWSLGFGSRYWQNTEHELTSELFCKINNEWAVRLLGRYDLKEVETNGNKIINRFNSKEITIIKDLHCWMAEASLEVGRDGDTTVWVAFKLKASLKTPFDMRDYYPVPKPKVEK